LVRISGEFNRRLHKSMLMLLSVLLWNH